MTKKKKYWRIFVLGLAVISLAAIIKSQLPTHGLAEVRQEVIDGFHNPACNEVLRLNPGERLLLSPTPYLGLDSPCFPVYLYRGAYPDAKNSPEAYIDHMRSMRMKDLFGAVVVSLVLWLMLWGAVGFSYWLFTAIFGKRSGRSSQS